MALDPRAMEALAEMLNKHGDESDDDGLEEPSYMSTSGSSKQDLDDSKPHVTVVKTASASASSSLSASSSASASQARAKDPKAIWDDDEVEDSNDIEDIPDDRIQPEYEIFYKQNVTAEDTFLNMGFKDISSASCNAIVVKMSFPHTSYGDISLDVIPTKLLAQSPKFRLFLHLPHKVDDTRGKAQWDGSKCVLSVTLPVIDDDYS